MGLGGLLAEDCHCCSQRAFILRFALVKMAAGHLGSSSGTHCWAQGSWEAARGAGSDAVGVGGRGLLAVCQFLSALGRLGRVLVQLRNCLTLKMPSPITMSIPDSADLKQKQACLPSMWSDRGATPTSAWRLRTVVALYAPETVLRQWFSIFWSSSPTPFQKNGVKWGPTKQGSQW